MSKRVKILCILIIILLILGWAIYSFNTMTAVAFAYIYDISPDGEDSYIRLTDTDGRIKIYCTEAERELVLENPDVGYDVTYTFNNLSPYKGKLKFIEFDEDFPTKSQNLPPQ